MRTFLTAGLAAIVVTCLLTGCAAITWFARERSDRSDEAAAYVEWFVAQRGVESAELEYVPARPVVTRDFVQGTVSVAPGTDVPALLESARIEYASVLPDAQALELTVEADLPFAFDVSLDEVGPSSVGTAVALEQGHALIAVGGEVAVHVREWQGDLVETAVRIDEDDPAALFDATARVIPLLVDGHAVSSTVVAGPGAPVLPGEAGDGRDLVRVRSDHGDPACLQAMADATLAFVAAEPTTGVEASVSDRCTATLRVPLDDEALAAERVAEVAPLAGSGTPPWSPCVATDQSRCGSGAS